MSAPQQIDVLIVGAGMVGSALALALAPTGLSIRLIDSGNSPTLDLNAIDRGYAPRVSAINLASVQFLKGLDAWSAIAQNRVSPYQKMHVWDANSKAQITFDSQTTAFEQLGYIVENDLIVQSLLEQLIQYNNVTVSHSTAVQQITDENKLKRVQTSNEALLCKLVVGADGQFSKVRQLAQIPVEIGSFEQKAIVARIQTDQPHHQCAFQRFDHSGPIAYLPLQDGSSSIVWSCDTGLAQQWLSLSDQQFAARTAEAMGNQLGAVTLLSKPLSFDLKQIHAQHYVEPRIALIGDAAHRTHPLGGLGGNIGLMDAATLAEVIIKKYGTKCDFGLKRNLRRYERWRKHQNNNALNAMQLFKSAFGTDSPAMSLLRESALNLADSNAYLKAIINQAGMGTNGFINDLPKSCQVRPYLT